MITGPDGRHYVKLADVETRLRSFVATVLADIRDRLENFEMTDEERVRLEAELVRVEANVSRAITAKIGALGEDGGTA